MNVEQEIETKSVTYATRRGFLNYKLDKLPGKKGLDQLFVGYNGVAFFVEFKAPGKNPTKKQWKEINTLRERNHKCYIIDNYRDFQDLINRFRHAHRAPE